MKVQKKAFLLPKTIREIALFDNFINNMIVIKKEIQQVIQQ